MIALQKTFTLLIQVMSLMKWACHLVLSTMDSMFRVRGDLANGDGDVPDPIGANVPVGARAKVPVGAKTNVPVGADDAFPDPEEDKNFGLWSWQHSRFRHPMIH